MVLGALAVSALLFFFVTRRFLQPQPASWSASQGDPTQLVVHTPEPGSERPPMLPKESTAAPLPKPEEIPPQPSPQPVPAPVRQVTGFSKPMELGAELMRRLADGDLAGAARILGCEHSVKELAAKSMLEQIFHRLDYRPAAPEELQMVGEMEGTVRLAVPLRDPKGARRDDLRLLLDVDKDEKLGWKVTRIHLPQELEVALAAPPLSPTPAPSVEGSAPLTSLSMATPLASQPSGGLPAVMPAGAKVFITVDPNPDALTFAGDFVHTLLLLNYERARRLVDEDKVPPVKMAALCIVLEDGQFQLLDSKPIQATVANESNSWVVARIHSTPLHEDTEFGLEMELSGGHWRISGLNLSKLLADTAKASTAAEGVPFTPMVKDPKGGESIALYFEYNSDILVPRARKQLDIVVIALKTSGHRKLRIGGHTDSKGSDIYNVSLSAKRAKAVKSYILSQGVPAEQVETVAFGKADPLSPNRNPDGTDNPEGRSHNRRAQILLDF